MDLPVRLSPLVRAGRLAAAVVLAAVALVGVAPVAAADEIRDDQWWLDFLNVSQAHQVTRGEGVTVAVVDTGVDARHPDLSGSVLPGEDFLGESDGRVDDQGHGTGMASLIAGHGHGSGDGILGIAPGAKILPVRVATGGEAGLGQASTLGEGIQWAADHGSKIINVSQAHWADDPAVREAVQYAQRRGAVIVAGPGNVHQGDTFIQYPAAYPGVVAVSAVGRSGDFAGDVSVQGSGMVLAAPGVDMVSANAGGEYAIGSGTSDSTALVSGVAALVWAAHPDLDAVNVINRLVQTADDRGPQGRDQQYGYGVVDPVAALTADVPLVQGGGASSASPGGGAAPRDGAGSGGTGRLLVGLLAGAVVLLVLAVVGLVMWSRSRSRAAPAGVPEGTGRPWAGPPTGPYPPGQPPYPGRPPPGGAPPPWGPPPGQPPHPPPPRR